MAKPKFKKGRRFIMLDHSVMDHPNYFNLSFPAVKLLNHFLYLYRGKNNGDLCCAFSLLKHKGWKSETTLKRACAELVAKGFIVRTRQGGRNHPNLYALTLHSIDECGGKLEVKPTVIASNDWKSHVSN